MVTRADGKGHGRRNGRGAGFRSAGACVAPEIRRGAEKRGFGVARLLTRWEEIAGPDLARVTRPLRVSYSRGGMGGTLVLMTTGPQAPLVALQEPALIERINASHGYAAISRIRLTQTDAASFAAATAGPARAEPPAPPEAAAQAARHLAGRASDPGLRAALERLGTNVHARAARRGGATTGTPDTNPNSTEPASPS
jgi:hypothetical protein